MEETMARFSSYERMIQREDKVEELKGDYQRAIERTENMMIELDSFLVGSSFDSV